jgi:hypothetical protein
MKRQKISNTRSIAPVISFRYPPTDPLFPERLKEKQRLLRDGFPEPLALRVHRALSWLRRAEDLYDDVDVRFVLLWIGFNAANAGPRKASVLQEERELERSIFGEFFKVLNELDKERRIYDIIHGRFSHEIRTLLNNQHVFHPFWQHVNDVPGFQDWEQMLTNSRKRINRAYVELDTPTILSILFGRLYVLRNQIMHGSATWNSSVNRDQVRDGASVLASLLPVFLDIMMDNPQYPWSDTQYPVVE